MAPGVSRARAALLVLAVLALVAAARQVPLDGLVDRVRAVVAEPSPAAPLWFVGIYALAALTALPCFPLGMLAGALFGVVRGTALVLLAATAGATVAYLLARRLLRGRVERRFGGDPRFRAIDRMVEREGWRILFLLRLSPLVPFGPSNWLYGLTSLRPLPYVLASAAGMLPGTMLYVTLGRLGRTGLEEGVERGPWELVHLVLGLLATAAAVLLAGRSARRALREREAEGERTAGPSSSPAAPGGTRP